MRTSSEILGHQDVAKRSRVAFFIFLSPRVLTKVKGRTEMGGVEVAILAEGSRLLRCEDLECCESPSRHEHKDCTRHSKALGTKLLSAVWFFALFSRVIESIRTSSPV